jgi:hypothetical protein
MTHDLGLYVSNIVSVCINVCIEDTLIFRFRNCAKNSYERYLIGSEGTSFFPKVV